MHWELHRKHVSELHRKHVCQEARFQTCFQRGVDHYTSLIVRFHLLDPLVDNGENVPRGTFLKLHRKHKYASREVLVMLLIKSAYLRERTPPGP